MQPPSRKCVAFFPLSLEPQRPLVNRGSGTADQEPRIVPEGSTNARGNPFHRASGQPRHHYECTTERCTSYTTKACPRTQGSVRATSKAVKDPQDRPTPSRCIATLIPGRGCRLRSSGIRGRPASYKQRRYRQPRAWLRPWQWSTRPRPLRGTSRSLSSRPHPG